MLLFVHFYPYFTSEGTAEQVSQGMLDDLAN